MRYQIYILSQYVFVYVHDCCVKVENSNRGLYTNFERVLDNQKRWFFLAIYLPKLVHPSIFPFFSISRYFFLHISDIISKVSSRDLDQSFQIPPKLWKEMLYYGSGIEVEGKTCLLFTCLNTQSYYCYLKWAGNFSLAGVWKYSCSFVFIIQLNGMIWPHSTHHTFQYGNAWIVCCSYFSLPLFFVIYSSMSLFVYFTC